MHVREKCVALYLLLSICCLLLICVFLIIFEVHSLQESVGIYNEIYIAGHIYTKHILAQPQLIGGSRLIFAINVLHVL